MKKCPFCAEDIQDEAVKCKHCGEFLNSGAPLVPPALSTRGQSNQPWYFSKAFVVIMLLSIGPLALPLVWWRPETSLKWKLVITALVLALTYALWLLSVFAFRLLNEQMQAIRELGI